MLLDEKSYEYLRRALKLTRRWGLCPIILCRNTRRFKSNQSNFFWWHYRVNIISSFAIQVVLFAILHVSRYLHDAEEIPGLVPLCIFIGCLFNAFTMYLDYIWGWGNCAGVPVYFLNSSAILSERVEGKPTCLISASVNNHLS